MTESSGRKPVPKKKSDQEPAVKKAADLLGDLDIPSMPAADEIVRPVEPVIADVFDYDVAFNLGFVGIGQGGSRVAQTFHRLGYRRVVAIDGAHQDLLDLDPSIPRLDLETSGSAKDIAAGEASVASREEDLWHLYQTGIGPDVDYIILCACLGGGTGSGAIHKALAVARDYMQHIGRPIRVGCLVSLPTGNEGQRVCANALQTFRRLQLAEPSPTIIVDNKRISELFPVAVTKFYQKCNEQIALLLHLFNQLSAQRSQLVTFDRAELASLLDSGIVTFGASTITKHDRAADVSEAVRTQLAATALAQVDLKSATGAGCIFVGNETTLDTVPEGVLAGGFDMCLRMLRDGGVLHRGVYIGASSGLRCLTLLAGLDQPRERLRELGATARLHSSKMAEFFGIDD